MSLPKENEIAHIDANRRRIDVVIWCVKNVADFF